MLHPRRIEQIQRFRVAYPDAWVGVEYDRNDGTEALVFRFDNESVWWYANDGWAGLPIDADGEPVDGGWALVCRMGDTVGGKLIARAARRGLEIRSARLGHR